jgi:hypothetical protein
MYERLAQRMADPARRAARHQHDPSLVHAIRSLIAAMFV